jgi:AcrR family transcriptional regulator
LISTPDSDAFAELPELRQRFELLFEHEPELRQLTIAARRLLAVAATLFFEHGSAATSVRELTRACGLSPGALYNHFGSRDELLFTLVRTGHVRAQRDLDAAIEAGPASPRESLIRFVRAYTEIHLRFPPFSQLIHREYVHLSPDRKAEIVIRRRRMRDQLISILRDGVSDGSFRLVGGPQAEVGSAMMVLDMCSRTSEWFSPTQPSQSFSDRYATAALRLVGASES